MRSPAQASPEGPLPTKKLLRFATQISEGLAKAHSAGIVHRDLKPENVMLCERGGRSDVVKVLDFGIAKLADDADARHRTKTGMPLGTPLYMSPEALRGDAGTIRSDLYSLGATLYELMTGQPVFSADTPHQVIDQISNSLYVVDE